MKEFFFAAARGQTGDEGDGGQGHDDKDGFHSDLNWVWGLETWPDGRLSAI